MSCCQAHFIIDEKESRISGDLLKLDIQREFNLPRDAYDTPIVSFYY